VISPGINDGALLTKTVEDLAKLYPKVASLAVVPVGLTRYRENLSPLKAFSKRRASSLLDGLEPYRKRFRKEFGVSFVYPSDELYIKAGRDFPPARVYDGYPQMDNGVGLVRDFLDEFGKAKKRLKGKGRTTFFLPKERSKENGHKTLIPGIGRKAKRILLVTGVSFAPYLKEKAEAIESITGLSVSVLAVKNELFGHSVTVAGLLAGQDIANALKGKRADAALVPTIAIREGHGVFLDDLTPADVERIAGVKVIMVEPTARGLVEPFSLL
jgi:NifB/MoaA-like Fe-S oxidoreductase